VQAAQGEGGGGATRHSMYQPVGTENWNELILPFEAKFLFAQPKGGNALARGARTECDACVVRWTEAALSGPCWQSVQGERSSDVVASLPVGPGLSTLCIYYSIGALV
jgi:hypothetical protein